VTSSLATAPDASFAPALSDLALVQSVEVAPDAWSAE
jgi:hypothetical protein